MEAMGIRDAKKKGIPSSYVDKYLRPFIPAEAGNGEELEREAKVKIFNARAREWLLIRLICRGMLGGKKRTCSVAYGSHVCLNM